MNAVPPCPKCQCEYAYPSGHLLICPECAHEWNPELQEDESEDTEEEEKPRQWLDANGNELQDGDTIILTKTLDVKGAAKLLKRGTKVKNIRLVDGDHDISCKIPGFGAMGLKTEFVKKA